MEAQQGFSLRFLHAVKKGGQILVARNCHKAVYHAIYLRELVPTYIYPQSDSTIWG